MCVANFMAIRLIAFEKCHIKPQHQRISWGDHQSKLDSPLGTMNVYKSYNFLVDSQRFC